MSFDKDVAEAQALAAQLHATGAPIALEGAPHSPKRIMFYHGATTGHAACSCPVVDEHGHNVNPGRQPLDGRAVGRAEGSRKSRDTYARRRARRAADELAVIDPRLWDDETRRIVGTLATVSAPSRIDAALDEAFPLTWDDLPDGTEDLREAFAADLAEMEEREAYRALQTTPAPYPTPRPRPDPDPRPRPEPHPRPTPAACEHQHLWAFGIYNLGRPTCHEVTAEERASIAEAADRNAAAAVHDNGADYRA